MVWILISADGHCGGNSDIDIVGLYLTREAAVKAAEERARRDHDDEIADLEDDGDTDWFAEIQVAEGSRGTCKRGGYQILWVAL